MTLDNVFFYSVGFLYALSIIFSLLSFGRQSFLVRSSPNMRCYRKPLAMRIAMGAFGFMTFIFPFWVALDLWEKHDFRQLWSVPMLAIMFFIGTALCGYLAGPQDLLLDVEQHTYHTLRGWLFFSKSRSGPWAHIWGVWTAHTSSVYLVGITWRSSKGSMTLGRFSDRPSAEQFAESTMSLLQVSRVMAPKAIR